MAEDNCPIGYTEANMRHARHSKPLRAVPPKLAALAALAALAVLVASTAGGQASAQASGQQQSGAARAPSPVPTGPSYGPVLHPQPLKSEPGAQPEQTPQAQEEKAGAAPPGRASEVDPSARPAAQPKDPAKADPRKDGKKAANRSARRSSPQRVDIVPPASASGPLLAPSAPAQPAALRPGPAQINSCPGGTCIDTSGTTYNTGVGNAAVSSQGRLCTRSGNTMQCF
jgi:hypothetical protein